MAGTLQSSAEREYDGAGGVNLIVLETQGLPYASGKVANGCACVADPEDLAEPDRPTLKIWPRTRRRGPARTRRSPASRCAETAAGDVSALGPRQRDASRRAGERKTTV